MLEWVTWAIWYVHLVLRRLVCGQSRPSQPILQNEYVPLCFRLLGRQAGVVLRVGVIALMSLLVHMDWLVEKGWQEVGTVVGLARFHVMQSCSVNNNVCRQMPPLTRHKEQWSWQDDMKWTAAGNWKNQHQERLNMEKRHRKCEKWSSTSSNHDTIIREAIVEHYKILTTWSSLTCILINAHGPLTFCLQ